MKAGDIVGGRYRLERQLGEGGMGAVREATHTITQKAVALKLLLGRGDDPALRERLLREARAVCAVLHPNVVPVHDVFELDGGAPALVMDLLTGESLASKLAREGRLPADEVVRVALDVLAALEAAHARGIVHRDLKPDNIFLARSPGSRIDEVKVLDFGIAKVTTLGEADAQVAALTRTDAMVGTPYYMAPEQVYGEKDIDARSDLWSMGIVMYECLAGVRPTEGANLGQIFKLVTVGPIPPLAEQAPSCPASLVKLVDWCLERARDGRPASATALREALERVRAGTTIDGAEVEARAVDAVREPAKRRAPRWAAVAAGVAGVLVVGGAGIAGLKVKGRSVADAPPPAVVTAAVPALVPLPEPAREAEPARERPAVIASAAAPAAQPPASAPKPKLRTKPAAAASAAPLVGDERAAGKVVVTPPF